VGGRVARVVGKRNVYGIFLENRMAINQLECSDLGKVICNTSGINGVGMCEVNFLLN
jgi:hypothetical protein